MRFQICLNLPWVKKYPSLASFWFLSAHYSSCFFEQVCVNSPLPSLPRQSGRLSEHSHDGGDLRPGLRDAGRENLAI